jgi:hypothetical protein
MSAAIEPFLLLLASALQRGAIGRKISRKDGKAQRKPTSAPTPK